jgi:hypothetical protein
MLLQRPAPRLVHLDLDLSRHLLPRALLAGDCANLRTLVLTHVFEGSLNNPPSSLPALEQLRVSYDATTRRTGLTDGIRQLLQSTPALISLEVLRENWKHADSNAADIAGQPSSRPLELAHLRTLRLCDYVENVRVLLRVLPTPTRGFHVDLSHDASTSAIWQPSASPALADVLARLTSFWAARTGDAELPAPAAHMS